MNRSRQLESLFSQKLDRAVFATYFLGAVVPMLALGLVAHRFALPALEREGDNLATIGMVGVLMGIGLLSLASFFALRRLIQGALDRMNGDNERLSAILLASRELSGALHAKAVGETAASCALMLTGATASYVLLRAGAGKSLQLCESAGDGAALLFDRFEDPITQLVEAAIANDEPQLLHAGSKRKRSGAIATPSSAAVIPFSAAKGESGALVLIHCDASERFAPEQIDAVRTLTSFTSVAIQNADLQDSQRNFFAHVTEILVAAIDAQLDSGDPRIGHSNRLAAIANGVGREMGLGEEQLQRLHFGALLHDIGYLKLDRRLHHDPRKSQSHPNLGHRMLSRIRLWENVAPIILHHHEWYDGSGYPEKISGDAIPLEARIISAADVLDKLVHEDYERPALSVSEALAHLERGKGRQFDPAVVDALKSLSDRGDLRG